MHTENPKPIFDQRWEAMYQLACRYYSEHGHLLVPHSHMTLCGKRLGRWIGTQRHDRKIGARVCTAERQEKLDAIGMVWEVRSSHWQRMYELAQDYAKAYGNLDIPIGYVSPKGELLGGWISSQRSRRKQGLIKTEEVFLLDELGMEWRILDNQWDKYYERCAAYMQVHGVDRIPSRYMEEGMALGSWLIQQKRAFREGRL